MPDLPGGSSAAPTLYQSMWVTTGVRRSGITTTSRPLASLKVVTFGAAAAARGASAPATQRRPSAAAAKACVSLIGHRGRTREWFDDRKIVSASAPRLRPTRQHHISKHGMERRRSASRHYRCPRIWLRVHRIDAPEALLRADAVGLGGRRRAVSGRRLGQAAARRLAGEGRVFLLLAHQPADGEEALGAELLPRAGRGRILDRLAGRPLVAGRGRIARAELARQLGPRFLGFEVLAGLLARGLDFLGALDVRIVRPGRGLFGGRAVSGVGRLRPGGTTSGERSRYSMPPPSRRRPRPCRMLRKILVSNGFVFVVGGAHAGPGAADDSADPISRGRCASGSSDRSNLSFVMPSSRCAQRPSETAAFGGFRPETKAGIRALLRRGPRAGIHTADRPPRQRWLHRRG